MASGFYEPALGKLGHTIDWSTDDSRAALVDDQHTLDAPDEFMAAVAGDEIDGATYARVAVTTRSGSETSGTGTFTGDNIEFVAPGASTNPIAYCVLYVHTGNDATASLLCYLDVADYAPGNLPVTVDISNGVYTLINAPA